MLTIHHGDCREVLKTIPERSIDAVVCDPPYHLTHPTSQQGNGALSRISAGFMNCGWDGGDIAFDPDTWKSVLRVLKPGGHLVAFGGSRTHHRLWCAIEDAGFELRDTLMWCFGTGFPKSHDVSKAIDKYLGAERQVVGQRHVSRVLDAEIIKRDNYTVGVQARGGEIHVTSPTTPEAARYEGFGTALKPAMEMICLARRPLEGTVAENVLRHGTGGLNIDACRVPTNGEQVPYFATDGRQKFVQRGEQHVHQAGHSSAGRWPPNLLHDGSDEVTSLFPNTKSIIGRHTKFGRSGGIMGTPYERPDAGCLMGYTDEGSAARFFPTLDFTDQERLMYCAKASKTDRNGSKHPTVKPIKLMEWLITLITPPGGVILDPFAGSGTTGQAAKNLGFDCVLIEQEAEYVEDIKRRFAMPEFVEAAD